MNPEFDAVVVGAGYSGCAAAMELARAGLRTLVVEQATSPGTQGNPGGLLWKVDRAGEANQPWAGCPVEREVVERRWFFLDRGDAVSFELRSESEEDRGSRPVTVLRSSVVSHAIGRARALGAEIRTSARVDSLVRNPNGTVEGVVVDGVPVGARITLLATGSGSRVLSELQNTPSDVTHGRAAASGWVAATHLIRLPEATINDRFHVASPQGVALSGVLGHLAPSNAGFGFLYTNRASVTVGVLAGRAASRAPYDVAAPLAAFESHPAMAPLLSGSTPSELVVEHLTERSPRDRVSGPGWIALGGAAGLEGSNGFATRGIDAAWWSGRLAATIAADAIRARDLSARRLHSYDDRLGGDPALRAMRPWLRRSGRFRRNPRWRAQYPRFLAQWFHGMMTETGARKQPIRRSFDDARRAASLRWHQLIRDALDAGEVS